MHCFLVGLVSDPLWVSFLEDAGDSENGETDAQQLFVPYRGYCARKGVLHLFNYMLRISDFCVMHSRCLWICLAGTCWVCYCINCCRKCF